ncbi:hypothetical protein [Chitinophaga sp.]|uniref:hypothetical protein n=1 Tax=Chitinophaga sp. TaxID=1869181 RepID=UPI0031CDE4A2
MNNKQKLFTLSLHQQASNWHKTLHLRLITKGNKPSTFRLVILLLLNYRHIPRYSNFNITINCYHINSHPKPSFDKSSFN